MYCYVASVWHAAERSSSGLIEFENKSDAIEALILTNHHPISSKLSYHFLENNAYNVITTQCSNDVEVCSRLWFGQLKMI